MTISHFHIGTFNTLNLVLPNVTFYGDEKYTPAQYTAKKAWMRHQLEQMKADIIGFQEVFHEAALREVLAESAGYQQASLFVANETGTGPVVALASRFPMQVLPPIVAFPADAHLTLNDQPVPVSQFSRPVIQANITLDTKAGPLTLTVFVTHLKSKRPILAPTADPADPLEVAIGSAKALMVRAAEATALRKILVETMRNNTNPVIVVGDINDSVNAVTSEILSGTPPYKRLSKAKKAAIWDVLLTNVKDIQSRVSYQDMYYTHIFNGYYESLDHIFVSDEFIRTNPKHVGYVEYVKVLNDHLIDETLSDQGVPKTQSDHGQVVTTIHLETATVA